MKYKQHFLEVIKFGFVGILNTLISLAVIYILMNLVGLDYRVSNISGYVAGLINSFFWNRNWTFKDKEGNPAKQAVNFIIVFLISYGIQFLALILLVDHFHIHENWAQPGAMIVYTGINYLLNKFITFRKNKTIA